MMQTLYGSFTLFRARGDQIERFGFAAFGLTVVPYILMSIMSLCGALLVPDYQALHVVRSYELDEAVLLGGHADGALGRAVQRQDEYKQTPADNPSQNKSHTDTEARDDSKAENTASEELLSNELRTIENVMPLQDFPYTFYESQGGERWGRRTFFVCCYIVPLVFAAIHLGIIGGMTHFRGGTGLQ